MQVSDGIIAPDYDADAMEVLKKKKGGKYCVLQVNGEMVLHWWAVSKRSEVQLFFSTSTSLQKYSILTNKTDSQEA